MKHLSDTNLSLKARGLLETLLIMKDGDSLMDMVKEKETAIKSGLRELEQRGYLRIEKRIENGTTEYIYHLEI